ncbi:MAG: recombinase family protein [Phycisphaerae bacterium]|nr:recombinase family protein [Phycisphaerae bacterium]
MIARDEGNGQKTVRCAIYTRKSTEEGLEMQFNSLDAQREAAEAYIASQRAEGWRCLPDRYDDGGFSGGNMDRPALKRLLLDIETGRIDTVVVYKVDRLSRSLLDFSQLVGLFDRQNVSFVSVTQQFNTTTSMGRLTLNILLSFAQFEREIIGERIRDKVAAAKKKGKHTGGPPILGYDIDTPNRRLVVNPAEADLVRRIFRLFLQLGSGMKVAKALNAQGFRTKAWTTRSGKVRPGQPWDKIAVNRVLNNVKYVGQVSHKGKLYDGEHEAIIDRRTWDRAQAILATNYSARAAHSRRKTPALLGGLIRCGTCGKAMGVTFTRRRGKGYRYYLCGTAAKQGYDQCPVRSVAAGEVERAVFEQLRGVFRSPDVVARTLRAVEVEAGWGPGNGPAPTEAEVVAALRQIDPLWESLFPAEQERIARLLVERVVVSPDGLEVRLRAEGLRSLAAEMAGPARLEAEAKEVLV